MSTNNLQINLTGNAASAANAFNQVSRSAQSASRSIQTSMSGASRSMSGGFVGAVQSATSTTSRVLGDFAKTAVVGAFAGVASSLTSTVTNVIGNAGQAVMSSLKSSVIDYNSALENANIGFSTMLGSGEKAQAFLKDLGDFAKTTPFEFGNLVQNAQQMMGMGVAARDVIPTLRALGDSVASMGGSAEQVDQVTLAFDQMVSKGTLDMGNMNQLLQGGVPSALKILAASYGKTTGEMQKMISTGKVQSADALPRLVRGIEKGTSATAALGGMMNKQSNTFAGAVSNISDALQQTVSSAFLPFFKIVERGAQALAKFTSSKQFTKWAADTGKTVMGWMNQVGGALNKVFSDPKVQKSVGQLGKAISDTFKAVGPALVKILPDLIQFGKDVLPSIIDGFTKVVKKIPDLINWWERLSAGLAAAGPTIAGVIGFLSDFGGTLFDVSKNIGNFVADGIVAFTNFVSDSKKRLDGFLGWIGGLVNQFTTIGNNIVAGLGQGIEGAWNGVMGTVHNLVNMIPLAVRKLLGIASPSRVFRSIGGWVGEGLHQGLLGSVDQIKSTSEKLANAITDQFKAKKISKTSRDAGLFWLKQFTDGGSMLQSLAKQRQASLDKLADLKSSKSDVYSSTKSATVAAGDVTGFGSAGDAVRGLQTLAANSRKFKADLGSLVKKGIDQTTFGQLVQAWQSDPTAALASADGLLANPTDLKQIIGLQKQLASAGSALGSYAAGHEYDTQIRNTSGKAKVLGWEMQAVARRDLQRVAQETHVHLHLSGHYAGTKDDLAKTVTQAIRDAEKRGTISKNWAKG